MSTKQRATHMQVIGGSGRGKSKFLEDLIRQDIASGNGVCVIDPHGTLYEPLVQWCATHRAHSRRRIHLINPSQGDWVVGFNPLRLTDGGEPSVRVDAMVNACAQVWQEDSTRTPLLRKCLRAVFYALAVRGCTLLEAVELASTADVSGLRAFLTDGLPDRVFRTVWADFNSLPPREFAEQFSSTHNRLLEFLASPVVRGIIGQRERVIDFRRCMDDGEIVLVNLSTAGQRLSVANARLLGTLLINDLVVTAVGRNKELARRRPFYLYIDECYDYLTPDIERILDQTRKFGLHLVLAHQRLGQLRKAGESIYNAVMGGTQTKIVFGGLEFEDAQAVVREVFLPEFNLELPKHTLDKPVVTGHHVEWLESESESTGAASSWSSGSVVSTGTSTMDSSSIGIQGLLPQASLAETQSGPTGWSETAGTASGTSSSAAHGHSEGGGWASSTTYGRHQTYVPDYTVLPTQVHSLEELMHLAIVKIKELPERIAVVKLPSARSIQIRTFDVKPGFAPPRRVDEIVRTICDQSAYTSSQQVVEAEIDGRYRALLSCAAAYERMSLPAASGKKKRKRTPQNRNVDEPPPLKDEGWS